MSDLIQRPEFIQQVNFQREASNSSVSSDSLPGVNSNEQRLGGEGAPSPSARNDSLRDRPDPLTWPSRDSLEFQDGSVNMNAPLPNFQSISLQTPAENSRPSSPLVLRGESSDDDLSSSHSDDVPLQDYTVNLDDQQPNVVDTLKGFGAWLERDASDRQGELRSLVARIDQLASLGLQTSGNSSPRIHSNTLSHSLRRSDSRITANQGRGILAGSLRFQEEIEEQDASSSNARIDSPYGHSNPMTWPSRDSLDFHEEPSNKNKNTPRFETVSLQSRGESSRFTSSPDLQGELSDDDSSSNHSNEIVFQNTAPIRDVQFQSRMHENVAHNQQSDVVDTLKGFGAWLERDAFDRQAELRSLAARIDQLENGLRAAPGLKSALRSTTQRRSPRMPRNVTFADEVPETPSTPYSNRTLSPSPAITPEIPPVPLPLPYPGRSRGRRMSFQNDNSPWNRPMSHGNDTPMVLSPRSSFGNFMTPQPSWGPPVLPPGFLPPGYHQPYNPPVIPGPVIPGSTIFPVFPDGPTIPGFSDPPESPFVHIPAQPPVITSISGAFVSTDPFRIQSLSSVPQELPNMHGGTETKTLSQAHLPFPVTTRPPSIAPSEKPRRVLNLVITTVLQQAYLHFLLRLPSLYFSRVSRVFEDAKLSLPDLRHMITADLSNGVPFDSLPTNWTVRPNSYAAPTLVNFKRSWESFIDSLLREWKTLNIVSALLLSAILTILQIQGSEDPVTRTAALLSLVCALMSLLFGCIFIVRFGTMRRMYKAASWAQEAQRDKTSILWNVWVLLAIPAVWLSWSLLLFLTSILSFVWRTGSSHADPPPLSPLLIIGPRIAITAVFVLGLLYFIMIVKTLKRYGSTMDKEWSQMVMSWTPDPRSTSFPATRSKDASGRAARYTTGGVFIAPEAFTRPVNVTGPLSPFSAIKIDNMDTLSPGPTEFPLNPSHHDVNPAEWKRFIEDLSMAWVGKHPALDSSGNTIHPLKLTPDLLDIWNSEFFCHRALELVLCKELHHEHPDLPRNSANVVTLELSEPSSSLSSPMTPRKEIYALYLTYVNCGERLPPSDGQRKFPHWLDEIPEQIHSIIPLTIPPMTSTPRGFSSDSLTSTAFSSSTGTPSFGSDISGENVEVLPSAANSGLGIFSQ